MSKANKQNSLFMCLSFRAGDRCIKRFTRSCLRPAEWLLAFQRPVFMAQCSSSPNDILLEAVKVEFQNFKELHQSLQSFVWFKPPKKIQDGCRKIKHVSQRKISACQYLHHWHVITDSGVTVHQGAKNKLSELYHRSPPLPRCKKETCLHLLSFTSSTNKPTGSCNVQCLHMLCQGVKNMPVCRSVYKLRHTIEGTKGKFVKSQQQSLTVWKQREEMRQRIKEIQAQPEATVNQGSSFTFDLWPDYCK